VKIKFNDGFVIINEDDFNADEHELFDAPISTKLEASKNPKAKSKTSPESALDMP
jgi:hypothetical protein